MTKEEVDRVRGGLEIKGWGRERGEKLGKGRKGNRRKFCVREARAAERGELGDKGMGGG